LRIKIPLQAAAVVVGIFAVYLLVKEPPEKPSLLKKEAISPENQSPRLEKNQETSIAKAELQQRQAKSQFLPSSAPASKTAQTKNTSGADEKVSMSRPKSVTEERSETSPAPSPASLQAEAKARTGRIVPITPIINSGQLPEIPEFKTPSLQVEPFADYEIVFRLQSPAQEQVRRDNVGLSQSPGAPAIAARQPVGDLNQLLDAVAGSTQPQTVWLTVPKSQYEQLKKQLRAIGTIESEKQIPLLMAEPGEQNNGQIQIKLTVLPPPETKRPAPSSPSDK